MTLIHMIFRSIVGDPVIRQDTDSDGFPIYEWKYPRLRHAEVWLFGGIYGSRGPYYTYAAPRRAWEWCLSRCRYLHALCVAVWSYRQDLYAVLGRAWFRLCGWPYHYCSDCKHGMCVASIRNQIKSRTEDERIAILSRSSLSNDLSRLHEQLRERGFELCGRERISWNGTFEASSTRGKA